MVEGGRGSGSGSRSLVKMCRDPGRDRGGERVMSRVCHGLLSGRGRGERKLVGVVGRGRC